MADYHPLIARAVAGLDKNTGENRRALYERARSALVTQLRGVEPALEESDITRERLALEEAIRKVEADAAKRVRSEPAAARRSGAVAARSGPARLSRERGRGRGSGRRRGASQPRRRAKSTSVPGEQRAARRRRAGRTPASIISSRRDRADRRVSEPDRDETAPPAAAGRASRWRTRCRHRRRRVTKRHEDVYTRPARSCGRVVKFILLLLVIGGLAGAGYWQRDPIMPVGGELCAAQPAPKPKPKRSRRAGRQAENRRPHRADERHAGEPANAPAAAVAQKVVLYDEDPSDPKGKRYVGSALWRTETVSPGPGLAPELAIRADVEIPERHMRMTWSLRRNTDKALPASHTIEILFTLPARFRRRRHRQRAGRADEAGRAGARRAARRPRGESDQRLFPHRPVGGRHRRAAQYPDCSRSATGSTSRSSIPAASAPSWRWRRARPACAPSRKRSGRGASSGYRPVI